MVIKPYVPVALFGVLNKSLGFLRKPYSCHYRDPLILKINLEKIKNSICDSVIK